MFKRPVMKRSILVVFSLGFCAFGYPQFETSFPPFPDWNEDGIVGTGDLLVVLSAFGQMDLDFDGIWDSVDDCVGIHDPCGVCNGTGEDTDEDGICDDVDDCIGYIDECGVCNGPGPVIVEVLYESDSIFIEELGLWYVFEYATDTLLTVLCTVSGCTDDAASNFNPEAEIDDGSCVYGPLECGGDSTITFNDYTYSLVAIGSQCWFRENLRTEQYANGDSIPQGLSDNEWWNTDEEYVGAQAILQNDTNNLMDFGRLYNWFAVDDERGLCPSGWHVPTSTEWQVLFDELGGEPSAGTAMKSAPDDTPSWNGTNTSGFSGLPGGMRHHQGPFYWSGNWGYWWSSTPMYIPPTSARLRYLSSDNVLGASTHFFYQYGLSVRCIKD